MTGQGIESGESFVKTVDIQAQRRKIAQAIIAAAAQEPEQVTPADSSDALDQPTEG